MSPTNLPITLPDDAPLSPARLLRRPLGDRPVLYIDRQVIADRYQALRSAFPYADVHYAMKCNPGRPVLEQVKALGGSFEIASYAELVMLRALGVDPATVLYSNPVKSRRDIRQAYAAGVRCFAFHSLDELDKLAAISQPADPARVYLRLAMPIGESAIASEGKFGQLADTKADQAGAVDLLLAARDRHLVPYGLALHVGSQMEDPQAWATPLSHVAAIMGRLQAEDITLGLLDLGGGFPAYHAVGTLSLETFGKDIAAALDVLPYRPAKIAIEPGRALVSDAGVIAAKVYGSAMRGGQRWLYLSVGAFNGIMEALESATLLRYPMVDSRAAAEQVDYVITGPSCDSQDTIAFGQTLSAGLHEGDTILIYTTGAYTTAYASHFNGFQPPRVVYLG